MYPLRNNRAHTQALSGAKPSESIAPRTRLDEPLVPSKPLRTAQDELREIEERERAEAEAEARRAAEAEAAEGGAAQRSRAAGRPSGGEEGAVGTAAEGAEFVDPTEGMNARQKKLWELQQKMQASRKLNQQAVIQEKKKEQVSEPTEAGKKYKWFVEGQKRKAEEVAALGLPEDEAWRLMPAEKAEEFYKRHEKGPAPEDVSAFKQKNQYEKRFASIPYSKEDYERMRAENPDFYRDADSLLHGKSGVVPKENVDRMVADLEQQAAKRAKYSRRRPYRDDKDVDAINDRNAHFNRKLERSYKDASKEIKANLERGTALPQ